MQLCDYGCNQEGKFQLKNKKWCCSEKFTKCSEVRRKNSKVIKDMYITGNKVNPSYTKESCEFCKKIISVSNIYKHKEVCYLNPKNLILCPVCKLPIKNYKGTTTCSNKCARKFFDNHTNKEFHRKICFIYHKKECIICGENNIVSVHHFDEDHSNNSPENLIPLCLNHHKYIHTKYKGLVINKVEKYIQEFLQKPTSYSGNTVDL